MSNDDPWFYGERAVAFASLVLTERRDVRPRPAPEVGVDLLVEMARGRRFGVQLVPCLDLPGPDAVSRLAAGQSAVADVGMPVCVFVIGVRKPEGVFRWLVEPVVRDGGATLEPVTEAGWQPLEPAAVARLIDTVSAWYDARDGRPRSGRRPQRSAS